jgi:hypothetical protein
MNNTISSFFVSTSSSWFIPSSISGSSISSLESVTQFPLEPQPDQEEEDLKRQQLSPTPFQFTGTTTDFPLVCV